ncbi:MAG: glycine C-acetyltransferase [Acidobacteria bacterium]|nr:glycine C-acetyltransferase [Acidobacteriota bacterium]
MSARKNLFLEWAETELEKIRQSGTFKEEKIISSPQGAQVAVTNGVRRTLLNLCANNYLGLANHPEIIKAASEALRNYGFGLSSVRFICGTQDLHKRLEYEISRFLNTEDTILYTSCFDANGGLFETLLGPEDCVISDALNHASIIDGIRLSKAQRKVYRHADLVDLEKNLQEAQTARFRMIATDGVFSMHGDPAPLPEICELARKYQALVMVDDSHATGLIGEGGRGTPEYFGVSHEVDIVTSTLGKALGGASGGFTTGARPLIELLRQRSRPYLFSNTVAPAVVAGSLKGLELLRKQPQLVRQLASNTSYFRSRMAQSGFQIKPGVHPIVPILIGDEARTLQMAGLLDQMGIFVVGFSYPVVPKGEARIRVQISAAHSREQLELAVEKFVEAGRQVGLLA